MMVGVMLTVVLAPLLLIRVVIAMEELERAWWYIILCAVWEMG